MKRIVFISVHPDDESLGCGGTLLRHKADGDEIYWIIVTNISSKTGHEKETVAIREFEIEAVSNMYGFKKTYKLKYPTMSLSSSTLLSLVPEISKIFLEIEPEIIYTVNRSDAHSDHRIVFNAVAACTKSFRYPFIKRVLMYECISETEFAPPLPEYVFSPNYFVDITKYLERKIEIMKVFTSEIGEHPFPRSEKNIEALATFRGASVGVIYAEAFQIIKFIEK